jgi:hypothetical protein
MSTKENRELQMLKSYIKGAMTGQHSDNGPRMEGYYAALQGVLDFINTLERPINQPKKTG